MKKKIIRYSLGTLAGILGVILLLWLALLIYVNNKQDVLIPKITGLVEEKMHGKASVGDLSVSLFATFPVLSLKLSDVSIRDSLYGRHGKDFVKAEAVFLKVSIMGLIKGNSPVAQVILSNGEVNIITDSAGYNNEYMLSAKPGKDSSDSVKKKASPPDIVLKQMLITYQNPLRNKLHQGLVRNMHCRIREAGKELLLTIDTRLLVKSLAFNTDKGSYVKDKVLEGDFKLRFDKEKKLLIIKNVRLDLDDDPFYFDGIFHMDKVSPDFVLNIEAKKVSFSKAASLLHDSTQKKLNLYSFTNPVAFRVELSGKTVYRFIPLVKVVMKVDKNKLSTPNGMFEDCTFEGSFVNEKITGEPRTDENSMFSIKNFSGRWEDIYISSKSAIISNLTRPFLECDLNADVDMQSLSKLAGSSTLQFLKGNTLFDVVFKGPIYGGDSIASSISGDVKIVGAEIKYLPRDMLLSDCNGTLTFTDNDLSVPKLVARVGQTKIQMNGTAKNFLSMINVSPEKLVIDWQIYSPNILLNDFKGFLTKPREGKKETMEARFSRASSRIDKMFTDGDVHITLRSEGVGYKNFRAASVKAKVTLQANAFILEEAFFSHANGSMNVKGKLVNGVKNNNVSLTASMKNMEVPILFAAFGNFGQDAITHENMRGILTANVNYQTAISDEAEIVGDSSRGRVDFLLQKGELINFEPLEEIGKKAFKKQDFSRVRFADLKNRLDIQGTAILVNPMEIRSTALNFFVEGIYDIKKGTDMSIGLPLNNLTRSQADTDISKEGKIKKGIVLRLRARTGDDGKLKVGWDPLRRSIKKKRNLKDSAEKEKEEAEDAVVKEQEDVSGD